MTLPLAAALAPEPAAMPLLDIEDSFADVLLEDFVPAGNLAGVRLHLLSLSLQELWSMCLCSCCAVLSSDAAPVLQSQSTCCCRISHNNP